MSRTRSRYSVYPSQKYFHYYANADGVIGNHYEGFRSPGNRYEHSVDTVTPNFEALIASGVVVNNPFTYKSYIIEYPSGSQDLVHPNGGRYYAEGPQVNHSGSVALTKPAVSGLDYPTAKCLGAVDSTPYAMMEDIGEITETIRFLRQPLFNIYDLAQSFRKDLGRQHRAWHRRRAKKGTKKISADSLWLEYRFAFLPLLRSAYNIAESLQENFSFPERRIARANSSGSNKNEKEATLSSGRVMRRTFLVEDSYSCGVAYTVSNPLSNWRAVYGLRAKDIPVTLWNLLPLSFMVDRVINISDSLKGITNFLDPSITFHYGWKTRRLSEIDTSRQIAKVYDSKNPYEGACKGGGVIYNNFFFTRTPWSPSWLDTIPPVNLGGLISSISSVLDLCALISQTLGSTKSK